jgi:hypothetical protein
VTGYASTLSMVVALLVVAAALAALAAAAALLWASDRRRARLEHAVLGAQELWGRLPGLARSSEGLAPELTRAPGTAWGDRHPVEWAALHQIRTSALVPPGPANGEGAVEGAVDGAVESQRDQVARAAAARAQLWPLEELELLPAELLGWASRRGPSSVREAMPAALELLEVDRDVRRAIRPWADPPATTDGRASPFVPAT